MKLKYNRKVREGKIDKNKKEIAKGKFRKRIKPKSNKEI